jgi:predicted Zn-dependent protease
VNAYVAVGGYILVTRGLYDAMENDTQLAGVLAHAIAVVALRQHAELMQKANLLSAATRGADAYSQSRSGIGTLGNLVIPNTSQVFARGQERNSVLEADRFGAVLAARAGYDRKGLAEVLKKLGAGSTEPAPRNAMFSTHPTPADRLSSFEKR